MTKCGRPCAWEAEFLGGRGRPWEAVLSDWITKIRSDQRANQGARPPTASQIERISPENLTFDSNSTSDLENQMC